MNTLLSSAVAYGSFCWTADGEFDAKRAGDFVQKHLDKLFGLIDGN